MADIDIEAANKIRVAMGLKPLPVPGAGPVFKDKADGPEEDAASTLEKRSALAEDNWTKLQEEQEAKLARLRRKEAAKKAREAAERERKMVGLGLADVEDELDTKAWLRQQKKRQKGIERQRLEEEAAEEKKRKQRAEYSAKDLAGVKVGHEFGEFDIGDEQILTLKDQTIGGEESEDDELENQDLRDRERLQERLELKKRKPVYNPMDDDAGKGILSHYDEEIDGKKRNQFTLDGQGSTVEHTRQAAEDAGQRSKGIIVSLDILDELKPTSDYLEPVEVKIKKPKKSKKSKHTRKKAVDEDDMLAPPLETEATGEMDVDGANGATIRNGAKKRTIEDTSFADDDDLQAALAQQRRDAFKKRKKLRPEDLARQLREEQENAMDGIVENAEEPAGLILDETSEFVAHLKVADPEAESIRPKAAQDPARPARPGSQEQSPPQEDEDVDMESYGAALDREERASRESSTAAQELTTTGLEEEKTLGTGLAATLSLLRERGQLKDTDAGDVNASFRHQQHFLADKARREDDFERRARLQRERDRASGKFQHMSRQQQDDYARASNTARENAESRELANVFNREYKPNVELKYIDEFGRSMNAKEAFKFMSHKFHGKSSGKMKHEKRLKKIEEEKKLMASSALDTSGASASMNTAMGERAKKSKQAGIRLQ